jgi:hypothetical protein
MDEEPEAQSEVPGGLPPDTVLLPIQETSIFSRTTELQPGSKIGLAAIPTWFEVESTSDQESGNPFIIYVFHTPYGVSRYSFPAAEAGGHLRMISEHLGRLAATQGLVIAKKIPRYPGGIVDGPVPS